MPYLWAAMASTFVTICAEDGLFSSDERGGEHSAMRDDTSALALLQGVFTFGAGLVGRTLRCADVTGSLSRRGGVGGGGQAAGLRICGALQGQPHPADAGAQGGLPDTQHPGLLQL